MDNNKPDWDEAFKKADGDKKPFDWEKAFSKSKNNKPGENLTDEEMRQESIRISKEARENDEKQLNHSLTSAIGQERLARLEETLRQLNTGLKQLVITNYIKDESSQPLEETLRKISNDVWGHSYEGAMNAKPERVIKALEELKDKIGFV